MVGRVAGVGSGAVGLLRGEVAHITPAVAADADAGIAAAPLDDRALSIGAVDTADKLLEGGLMLELLDDGVQGLGPLLIVSLVVAHHGSLGSAGVDGRCPDQA